MVVFVVVKQLIFPKEMIFLEELFFPFGNTIISLMIVQHICSKKKHFLDTFVPRKRLVKKTLTKQKQFLRTWFHFLKEHNHFLGESFTYKNHLERTVQMVKTERTIEMVRTFGFGIFHL